MKRIVLAILVASFVVFFWGFLFWGAGVGTPFKHMPAAQEAAVASALAANVPEDGAYLIPDGDRVNAMDSGALSTYANGPIATIHVRKAGAVLDAKPMVYGFAHILVAVGFLAGLLHLTRAATASYVGRMRVVALASLAGVWLADFRQPIWFLEPWGFSCEVFIYDFVGLMLAGAILAKLMPQD